MQKGIKNISLLLVTLLFSVTLGAQNLPMGEKTLRPAADSVAMAKRAARRDSLVANRTAQMGMLGDSLHAKENRAIDSLLVLPSDTAGKRKERNFLDEIINGKNKDSLYYDVRGKMVHIYEQGDVTYGNMNIKADYMRVVKGTLEHLKQIHVILDYEECRPNESKSRREPVIGYDIICFNKTEADALAGMRDEQKAAYVQRLLDKRNTDQS